MKLVQLIETVLSEQTHHFRPLAVDIVMSNGNILLRSFHIESIDEKKQSIKGLTQQEEYVHAREDRDPVYCFLKLDDIKGLVCPDLGLEYSAEMSLARV